MKRAFFILWLVGLVAITAKADYLYWQLRKPASIVDGATIDDFKYVSIKRLSLDSKAQVVSKKAIDNEEDEEDVEEKEEGDSKGDSAFVAADAKAVVINLGQLRENALIYSYYVEYYNYSTMLSTEGVSPTQTYASLLQNKATCYFDETTPNSEIVSLKLWMK